MVQSSGRLGYHSTMQIGLTTAESVKLSYYQTKDRRPRVDDMAVPLDEQLLKNNCATTPLI